MELIDGRKHVKEEMKLDSKNVRIDIRVDSKEITELKKRSYNFDKLTNVYLV